jgi:transposase InsO family protein
MESPGRAGEAGLPAPREVRFSGDDLRQVRRVTARWAIRAGPPAGRADDFVIAVHEIAANAARYGSPAARLRLRVTSGAAAAEIRDSGCWRPAANAIAERWIASAHRECLDRMLVTGERHLRLVLDEYIDHYNTHRPHRALGQGPPAGRPHPPALGASVRVLRRDRLGGLIREYSQVA